MAAPYICPFVHFVCVCVCVILSLLYVGHKVHPFLDDPQLFYRFCDIRPPSEFNAPAPGGRLQQLMSLFSFSRNSTPSGSPAPSPTPRKRPLSGGDNLPYSNVRPRCVSLLISPRFNHYIIMLLLITHRSATSVGMGSRSSRGSIGSVLEECFDTISRLSPEVLILATLAKE